MEGLDVRDLLARVIAGDASAADDLDRMADKLKGLAAALRGGGGPLDTGGMGDRVRMAVVGPDGAVKATTDTGSGGPT